MSQEDARQEDPSRPTQESQHSAELTGFHYQRDGRSLGRKSSKAKGLQKQVSAGWDVSEGYAKANMLGPANSQSATDLLKNLQPTPRKFIERDLPRQGMRLHADGVKSHLEVVDQLGEAYWGPAIEWMKDALTAAGVTQGVEQVAEQVLSVSFSHQYFNRSLSSFLYLFSNGAPSAALQQKLVTEDKELEVSIGGSACPDKTYRFEVNAAGALVSCQVDFHSESPVRYILMKADGNTKKTIFQQTVAVEEKRRLKMEFTGNDCQVFCSLISIDVVGLSFIHSILETGAPYVVGNKVGTIQETPFFSEKLSLFDQAKKYAKSATIEQFIDFNLKQLGTSSVEFDFRLNRYLGNIKKELKNPFLSDKERKKKMRKQQAAMALLTHSHTVKVDTLKTLSGYQDMLTEGRLGDLFTIYMRASGSFGIQKIADWFATEMIMYQGGVCSALSWLHDRTNIASDIYPTVLEKAMQIYPSIISNQYKKLTLIHRLAGSRIKLLPLLLANLNVGNRYKVLSDPGRGNSVLSMVTYSDDKDMVRRVLVEIKKLTTQEQADILAMPAMDRRPLSEHSLVKECLRDIEQSVGKASAHGIMGAQRGSNQAPGRPQSSSSNGGTKPNR